MIKQYDYIFKLKHDNGSIRMKVIARNEEVARNMIMRAELCPNRAITLIEGGPDYDST